MRDPMNGNEIVEVLARPEQRPGEWEPVIGNETIALLQELPEESRETVRNEALSVLRSCVPPSAESGTQTGIVIGYVQSGKTMSFTTVSALALDNRYRIVIVLTGISVPLFQQSKDRLSNNLRLAVPGRRWRAFASDELDARRGLPNAVRSITSALQRWSDPRVPEADRETVLIMVMKNRAHLIRLNSLLSQLNMRGVPTLVIDDEADQASLNNMVNRGQESATYSRIVGLRGLLPHHTFLQYTATPQAPLLINLIDILSPGFAEVLTPGLDYTGGVVFFEQNLQLVRIIPNQEVPTRSNVLTEPPPSLLEAMRVFFLGVAAGFILGRPPNNRSMMVHPSYKTTQHADYVFWVSQIRGRWQQTLEEDEQSLDRQELLAEFEQAYQDLAATAPNIPAFPELVDRLPQAVRETVVTEVNTRQSATPSINWAREYPHILVGGQALDRGYTVEGLTVTYMPRGRGVGNADTIQQRARWFGYKAGYLGYCRVYLSNDTFQAYRSYVVHEEDVRRQLREHREMGRPLAAWRRAFLLDEGMRPTRDCVLNLDYMRGNYSNRWYEPKTPHDSQNAVAENLRVIEEFRAQLQLTADEGDTRRLPSQRHLIASGVSLESVYENLLTRLRLTASNDTLRYTGVLLQIRNYLEDNPQAGCDVYVMRPTERVTRGLNSEGEIAQLFGGAYPSTPTAGGLRQGEIYPGDRAIRSQDRVTLQIHRLAELRDTNGQVVARDVPAVAVWLPRELAAGWVIQDQGGND